MPTSGEPALSEVPGTAAEVRSAEADTLRLEQERFAGAGSSAAIKGGREIPSNHCGIGMSADDPGPVAFHDQPISQLLVKVATRCNIDCSYCYWFRDASVYDKPKLM